MTNTNTNWDLGEQIERLVREHIAASHKAAQEAMERAFSSAAKAPPRMMASGRRVGTKRPSGDIAALGDRLYRAVCAKPGETMAVLAPMAGASSRELHRPMTLLRRAGRVRAVGRRHMTRYFPMANGAAST
ncbi:MAG TPA: hypothetical protein VK841_03580 [Polyangiaceae bacterium]|jgi:hypothetical protein|nr:hypothetical protein [Polyangiaceae bacterium]